jgi:cell division protein ZapA
MTDTDKDKIVHSIIEILDKSYPVRCQESEVASLQEAALYLNEKIQTVKDSGKMISPERMVIVAALNLTHELLQSQKQKSSLADLIQHRIGQLQEKLDFAVNQTSQQELVYTTE